MIQYDQPPPLPTTVSERMAEAHFRPEDIGMPEGIFGMGRQDMQTWLPSNVLMDIATRQMSPATQDQMRNRKINRPTGMMQDWSGGMASGVYGKDGSLGVTRLVSDDQYRGTYYDERNIARHEVMHAISLETPEYAQDINAGAPRLSSLLRQYNWTIPSNLLNDPYHLWTSTLETILDHPEWPIAPQIRDYFGTVLPR